MRIVKVNIQSSVFLSFLFFSSCFHHHLVKVWTVISQDSQTLKVEETSFNKVAVMNLSLLAVLFWSFAGPTSSD